MSLTIEWRSRIEMWHGVLKNHHLYRPLGSVPLSGFVTTEQLTPSEALRNRFKPMPAGTVWGGKWEYGWFKGRVALPAEAAGHRIILRISPGGEGLVYLNGRATCSISWSQREVDLTTRARGGETYDILGEFYAGHGPTNCFSLPVRPGEAALPACPPRQQTVAEGTFGIWDEEAYQLHLDVWTLISLRDKLEPESLRVAEIDQGLRDFTTIVDFEQPYEGRLVSFRAARKRLRPLLAAQNGTTAPTLFAFGHAHLDVAWLWPLAHTERKAANTFCNQMMLGKEYPQYKYLQSQAHLFWMTMNRYPDVYRRVKQAVRAGSIVPEGGMWVEADTNISGGEALIRQFLHGKRFFCEEFGVESEILWLPDVFGYSGAMPQIMRGCGINYFATAKIFWNYNGGETFPYNTFTWEGIDGTGVLVHLMNDYNSHTDPGFTVTRWKERVQKDGISSRLMPFGWGDGGGGPTREHVEFCLRQKNLEGAPRVKLEGPLAYFRDLEKRGVPDARYVGELYYQCHRGTYTSQAKTKRGNRKGELALREAEMWAVAAGALARFKYPALRIETNWRKLLLNQFHDILPGSSIERVYAEAEKAYGELIADAGELAASAQTALTKKAPAITAFNSLNWPRTELVPLPQGFDCVTNGSGESLPVQKIGRQKYAEVTIPSCGWTPIVQGDTPAAPAPAAAVTATPRALENDLLRVTFNIRGEISSIFDKVEGIELAADVCNRLRMYKDTPGKYDAWDVDSMYELTPVELAEAAEIKAVSSGPLAGVLQVKRKINNSTLTQTITLRRGSRRIDFATTVNWHERHKMLKVNFPVNIHTHQAVHEIQFGHLARPNHKSRPFDADRFEVCNHKWSALVEEGRGAAVLNDCKYGLNVVGNSINLTLLRSPLAPDEHADQGVQEFTYAFYAWTGCFSRCDLVKEAYELNCPVTTAAGSREAASLLATDAANIVIEAVKPADDGSGDIIVRLYESKRTATRCVLSSSLPIASVHQADMLENPQRPLKVSAGGVKLDFRPFEIKTLRVKVK